MSTSDSRTGAYSFPEKNGAIFYAGQADSIKTMREEHESSGGLGVLFIKLGKTEYRGRMVVPERIRIVVFMHGGTVDLSEAIFVHSETVITVVGMFGGCTVILPAGVVPEVSGVAIFGGFTDRDVKSDYVNVDVNRPKVRVRGMTMFGGVTVMTSVITPPLVVDAGNAPQA